MSIKSQLISFGLGIMVSCVPLVAKEHTTTNKQTKLNTKQTQSASDILMNSYHYIEKLKHFKIQATILSEDIYKDDIIIQLSHKVTMEVRRPSKMFIDIEGDVKNQEVYLEHSKFTIYSKKYNMYGELKAKDTIDDTLDMLFDNYDIKAPLANLIYSDISVRLKPQTKGYYIGVVDYKDTKCDYVVFANEYKEFQVWIQRSNKPLIRKFIIIDKTTKEKLRSVTMLKWDLHPFDFFDRFKFVAPKNATKIDILPYMKD